jgi:hypothetical protein
LANLKYFGTYTSQKMEVPAPQNIPKRAWPFPSRDKRFYEQRTVANTCPMFGGKVSLCKHWSTGDENSEFLPSDPCSVCGETAEKVVDTCNSSGDNPPVSPPSTPGA